MRVDALTYPEVVRRVIGWAKRGESRYICVANTHMVMESHDDPSFRRAVNAADLVTSDGMPLVWALRRMGIRGQDRVAGPELTLEVCRAAAEAQVPVGFHGGSPETLRVLAATVRQRYPSLPVAYAEAPPFRPLTLAEQTAAVSTINASGARILFVGLGCPKQERWMVAHRGRVNAVMLGVGNVFDVLSGRVPMAPKWIRSSGLEWLFRLLMEPRRLWRRYAKHNPRFAVLLTLQLFGLIHFDQSGD